MRPVTPRLMLLVICAFILVGCGAPKDPVKALLDDVVEAAQDRDADAIAEHLADDLSAGSLGKDEMTRLLRQYLAAYKALDVSLSGVESVQRAGSAQVKFRARLTGVPQTFGGLGDLVPSSATYDFDVILRETPSGWLISQISWEER